MKEIKRYIVIGDIHGRSNWQKLVYPFDENTMYIFIGDYTDPYYGLENVTYEQMIEQILAMLQFKKEHVDNVVLLVGNHDLQYIIKHPETNRYDRKHAEEIEEIFDMHKELFSGVAYQIGGKYLITHAGVTKNWYNKWVKDTDLNLQKVCDNINNLWNTKKDAFCWARDAKFSDYYGTSATHGPLWIRPTSLWEYNLFGFGSGIIQVVGHTRFEHYNDEYKNFEGSIMAVGTEKTPMTDEELEKIEYWINDGVNKCRPKYNDNDNPDIIQIDCLDKETAGLLIDTDTLRWEKYEK